MGTKLIKAGIIISFIIINYILAIAIHELGHLCMGKTIGYSLVYYRVGPFKILRENGKWRLTRETIPGTLGQCLMMPPKTDSPEKLPAVPYHLGGGLFNLITAAISIPLWLFLPAFYGKVYFLMLLMLSLYFGILNLYPTKVSIPNDGYNIRLMRKNLSDRKAIYHVLQITGSVDLTLGEMPEDFFSYDEDGEYQGTMRMLNASRNLDLGNWELAESGFREVFEDKKNTAEYYRKEAKKEYLFCLILRGGSSEELTALYSELENELNGKNRSNVALRVLYAYDLLVKKDEKKAQEDYREYQKNLQHLAPGDKKMEMKLISAVTGKS